MAVSAFTPSSVGRSLLYSRRRIGIERGFMMRRFAVAALSLLTALVVTGSALADVKISDRPYVRHDGGTDQTIAACSVNNRQQNEPAATVAPHDPALMTAGANDYCSTPTDT